MSARMRMPRAARVGGLVLVDKPVGPSSFATVDAVARTHGLKAGHAGTLDPLASGLLLVLLGQSTRLARYLVGLDKRYVTEIELGVRTTTGDAEGDELDRTSPPGNLEAAIASLAGEVELPVPAASAVKIDGQRAYRLHRRGVHVQMPTRRSVIHQIQILSRQGAFVTLDLRVSSGTYVRSIADALGGHCRTLRRTEVGPFRVDAADPDRILPPRAALPFLPEVGLDAAAAAAIGHGRSVACPGEGPTRLLHRGALVAVGQARGGRARPETVLTAALEAGA